MWIVLGTGGACVFLWEHIARKNGVKWRPSVALRKLGEYSKTAFNWVGVQIAWFCSVFRYLELADLMESAQELVTSSWTLVSSPSAFFKGFYEYAMSLAKHKWAPYVGLVAAMAATGAMFFYYT